MRSSTRVWFEDRARVDLSWAQERARLERGWSGIVPASKRVWRRNVPASTRASLKPGRMLRLASLRPKRSFRRHRSTNRECRTNFRLRRRMVVRPDPRIARADQLYALVVPCRTGGRGRVRCRVADRLEQPGYLGSTFTRNIFAELGYRYMYVDYDKNGFSLPDEFVWPILGNRCEVLTREFERENYWKCAKLL